MSIVSTVIGAGLVVIGIIVLLRGDVTGSWSDPVVRVVGLDHTPLLGVIEIAAGVLIVIAGLAHRGAVLFFAAALIVFGIVVVAQPDELQRRLAVTATHGWWAIGLGAALMVSVFVTPVRSERVVQHHEASVADEHLVAGERVVGAHVMSDGVVADRVVGEPLLPPPVVGDRVVGDRVVGDRIVNDSVDPQGRAW